jgi:hypothetical protein
MRELGIWKPWGPSYRYQRRMEEAQKREALHLYPVAENYKKHLISEGVPPEKITTVPCCVDVDAFAFDPLARETTRRALGIAEGTTVGIYVGKFGGIYFSPEQAFTLFRAALDHFGDFHLLVLTPTHRETLMAHATAAGYPHDALTITLVPHTNVPAYLSAADFAFSLINPTPMRKFCSPIKHGEYWANGLPVLMPERIGDDSEILRHSQLGILFEDTLNQFLGFDMLNSLLESNTLREKIQSLADTHRSMKLIELTYQGLFRISDKKNTTYSTSINILLKAK